MKKDIEILSEEITGIKLKLLHKDLLEIKLIDSGYFDDEEDDPKYCEDLNEIIEDEEIIEDIIDG